MINNQNIILDPQGVGYSDHTLMKGSPIRGRYSVKDGTKLIMGVAFRKREQLSALTLPEGLLTIGDAAFSFCKSLKEVTFPASVEYIGVAAFSCSGLECVTFLGTPKVIERNVFLGCNNLKQIIVPEGKKQFFKECIGCDDSFLITESEEQCQLEQECQEYDSQPARGIYQKDIFGNKEFIGIQPSNLFASKQDVDLQMSANVESDQQEKDLFGNPVQERVRFIYNNCYFNLAIDDKIKLSDLFSTQDSLEGDPSYQFRKKFLFVFLTSATANRTNPEGNKDYALAANVPTFKLKYSAKYNYRNNFQPRIFVMVCDDNKNVRFFDEVKLLQLSSNSIIVKSLIRF